MAALPATPFEIGQRVTTDAANAAGVPANTVGTVVGVENNPTSTGIQWIITVRVQYDDGNFDWRLPSTDITAL